MLDGHEIDSSGDAGFKVFGREPRDSANAGLAGGQLLPVIGFAGAERRDDAHAGHHHHRSACRIKQFRHLLLPRLEWLQMRSTSARPSPRQWPTLVTTARATGPVIGCSTPVESNGANSLP